MQMGVCTFSQSHERQEYSIQSLRGAINSTSVVKLCSLVVTLLHHVTFHIVIELDKLFSALYLFYNRFLYLIRRNSVREVNKCDEALLDSCTVGIVHRWHSTGI